MIARLPLEPRQAPAGGVAHDRIAAARQHVAIQAGHVLVAAAVAVHAFERAYVLQHGQGRILGGRNSQAPLRHAEAPAGVMLPAADAGMAVIAPTFGHGVGRGRCNRIRLGRGGHRCRHGEGGGGDQGQRDEGEAGHGGPSFPG